MTAAFERAATLEATAAALEAARRRLLDESIEPLEDLLAENWRKLFVDRPGIGLQGDGTLRRRIGSEELDYEQFSDGEKMVAQLILRVLVLRATTRLGFFWVDEPLEHLDPDAPACARGAARASARVPVVPAGSRHDVRRTFDPAARTRDSEHASCVRASRRARAVADERLTRRTRRRGSTSALGIATSLRGRGALRCTEHARPNLTAR